MATKGSRLTDEAKRKLSEAHKAAFAAGRVHPFSGRQHSEETRRKWSERRKGRDNRTPGTIARVKSEWTGRRGKEAPSWKGGITPIHRMVRTMKEYFQWRHEVYERDNYKCTECKIHGVILNADHIIPFSYILRTEGIRTPDDARKSSILWDVENGRTLCKQCHDNSPTVNHRILLITLAALKQELRELQLQQ